MKRMRLSITGLLAVLALASCYWRPDFNSGSLSLELSGIIPKAAGDVVRVYLLADGLLFSTGGGVPFTAEVSAVDAQQQRIAIKGLPIGPKYVALVGLGPVADGLFNPYYYGASPQFTVTPNADTAVTVTMSGRFRASYSPQLLGRNLIGVAESGSSVYAAEVRKIFLQEFDPFASTWTLRDSFNLETDLDTSDDESLSAYQINGLSTGWLYDSTHLDTDNGFVPFYGGDGWVFNTTVTTNLGGTRDLLESGRISLPPAYTDYAVFFRRENGLGGTYVPVGAAPDAWSWVNLDVTGMSDLTVSYYNGYFAANGIAFALPPAFLLDATPTLAEHRIDLPEPAPVQSVGFRPSGTFPGGTLSLGTTDGVWQAEVDESAGVMVTSGPTQVSKTAGDSIEQIAISSYNSYAEAYLSRYFLYIRNYDGLTSYVERMPFFAAVPGRATGMSWDSMGTLYISGTEGLAAVYVGYYGC